MASNAMLSASTMTLFMGLPGIFTAPRA
jgi:hypothetical protein